MKWLLEIFSKEEDVMKETLLRVLAQEGYSIDEDAIRIVDAKDCAKMDEEASKAAHFWHNHYGAVDFRQHMRSSKVNDRLVFQPVGFFLASLVDFEDRIEYYWCKKFVVRSDIRMNELKYLMDLLGEPVKQGDRKGLLMEYAA